ncbi:RING/U-box superfamily protein [Striga asiatica]|uniref:RING/U-box superfamily protein n=1 Tax=Striga asiatica TaxID=4170 RepID=A0A5A7PTT5_STRAF|nr:RING/U-box superfamily protein [Striga asiatica]
MVATLGDGAHICPASRVVRPDTVTSMVATSAGQRRVFQRPGILRGGAQPRALATPGVTTRDSGLRVLLITGALSVTALIVAMHSGGPVISANVISIFAGTDEEQDDGPLYDGPPPGPEEGVDYGPLRIKE